MKIRFPFPIKQIDDRTVDVPCETGPILDEDLQTTAMRQWGVLPIEIAQLEEETMAKLVRLSLRVSR